MSSKEKTAKLAAEQKQQVKTTDIVLHIEGIGTKVQAERVQSELSIIRNRVNKTVEKNTRSLSSYFKEFRTEKKDIAQWLRGAHARGRTFNESLVHDIIINGNIQPIRDAADLIQAERKAKAESEGKEYKEPQNWSAARLNAAFIRAVETTVKPQPKAATTK